MHTAVVRVPAALAPMQVVVVAPGVVDARICAAVMRKRLAVVPARVAIARIGVAVASVRFSAGLTDAANLPGLR